MNSSRGIFRSRLAAGFCLLLMLSGVAIAQSEQPLQSVTYRLGMSRPVSHLFEVSIEVELPKESKATYLDFQMPKWSPGRYAVFDFAKNVQEFQALGGICPPVGLKCVQLDFTVRRVDDQTWRVEPRNTHSLTIRYKVFGNDLSGTFSQLNANPANFNGGSSFIDVGGHKQDPGALVIDPPAGW